MKVLILCDIDGVIADPTHRLGFLERKDYDSFYSDKEILADGLIVAGASLLHVFLNYYTHVDIAFVTGRPTRTAATTKQWLQANITSSLYCEPLYMREDSDHRKDFILKPELVGKALKNYGTAADLIYFIDDNPANVKAVCEKYPNITGLTFGTKRLGDNKNEP